MRSPRPNPSVLPRHHSASCTSLPHVGARGDQSTTPGPSWNFLRPADRSRSTWPETCTPSCFSLYRDPEVAHRLCLPAYDCPTSHSGPRCPRHRTAQQFTPCVVCAGDRHAVTSPGPRGSGDVNRPRRVARVRCGHTAWHRRVLWIESSAGRTRQASLRIVGRHRRAIGARRNRSSLRRPDGN